MTLARPRWRRLGWLGLWGRRQGTSVDSFKGGSGLCATGCRGCKHPGRRLRLGKGRCTGGKSGDERGEEQESERKRQHDVAGMTGFSSEWAGPAGPP